LLPNDIYFGDKIYGLIFNPLGQTWKLNAQQTEPEIMENHHKGMIIPHDRLSQEALQGLIEEFVTRDGTDTGYIDGSLEKNVEMIIRQLKRRDVFIVFDEATQTANIMPKDSVRAVLQEEK
jgi:uncharacterized protein